MKSSLRSIYIIVSFGLLLIGCAKEFSSEDGKPTLLQITLKDASGNIIKGGSVKLYASGNDYVSKTNQVDITHVSDSTGKVTFGNLHSLQYFWDADFESKSNLNGVHSSLSLLASGVTNRATSTLTCTGYSGVIKLVNNSTLPYSILITPSTGLGSYNSLMAAGSTQMVRYATPSSTQYSINGIPQSGVLSTGTGSTFYVLARDCDVTDTLSFH